MAAARSRYWQELTSEDIRTFVSDDTVALFPVAAIEQHGPHLPLATDTTICQALVERIVARLPAESPVVVLPLMAVGLSVEHGDYPGTLSVSAETLMAAWTEIGECVASAGVRRLALLNTHGGQPQIVDLAAQRLRIRHRMLVGKINAYRYFRDSELFSTEEIDHGIHGGAIETSLMLHVRPDLVRMDRAADFVPLSMEMKDSYAAIGPFGPVGFAWQSQDLHRSGAAGNAAAADAEKGRLLIDRAVKAVIAALSELATLPLELLRDAP